MAVPLSERDSPLAEPLHADSDITARRLAPDAPERGVSLDTLERDQMLERMRSLRRILPVLAQEMACARRQAARLRTDNRQLTEQVRQLRATIEAREHKPA
jgi:hypothetical protein